MNRALAQYVSQFDADRPLSMAERCDEWMASESFEQWLDEAADELDAGRDYLFHVRNGFTRKGFTRKRVGVTVRDVWDDMGYRPATIGEFRMAAKRLLEGVADDYFKAMLQDSEHEAEMEQGGI